MEQQSQYPGPERRKRPRQGPAEPARHAFYTALRWLGDHFRGFYTILGLFLSIGLGMALAAIWGFAEIAEAVMEGETQTFDERVLLWISQFHGREFDIYALEITSLGSGVVVWMTVILASAFLWASRHRYSVLLLWVAAVGGVLLNTVLKVSFDRPRPEVFEWRTPYVGLSSFPSGHATTAAVVYWTLAYLVTRIEPSRVMRQFTWGFAVLVIFLIGLTRLYLGVHYPSDVLGGFIVGIAWATFAAAGIEVIRYFRGRKPEVEEVEKDLDGAEARAPEPHHV